jgi:hypothetical protein
MAIKKSFSVKSGLDANANSISNLGVSSASLTLSGANAVTLTTTGTTNVTLPVSGTLLYSGGALGTPASGNLSNCTFPTLNQNTSGSSASCTGNAATATKLATSVNINGVAFDGSAAITVTADANTLSGTTLKSTVVTSSLTSVGTIGTGVWQGTAIADTYLGTISTASKVSNSATTATSANTASAIVARDASGNFTAGTITASLTGNVSGSSGSCTGNAATATKLSLPDLRSTSLTPSYFGAGINGAFMSNATDSLSDGGAYHGVIQLQQWSDASGGGAHQLGFTDNNNIWHRGSSGGITSWASWYKLIDTNNYGSSITSLTAITNISTGAAATAGTITGDWSLGSGSKLRATYADLAENYTSDQSYDYGIVLMIGGDEEVTIAAGDTQRLAGVVSKNPAYLMNSDCEGKHVVAIALQGRTPVRVMGKVNKGDFLVSAGDGYAKATDNPRIGSIIGKSLESFDGQYGMVEAMVGRL